MHHAMSTKTVDEVQTLYVWRLTNDGMVVGSHFIEAGPRASWVHFGFCQHRYAKSGMRQDLFHESLIEVSFKTWRFFRIIPGKQNSLSFAAKMKPGRHVYHHRKSFG